MHTTIPNFGVRTFIIIIIIIVFIFSKDTVNGYSKKTC